MASPSEPTPQPASDEGPQSFAELGRTGSIARRVLPWLVALGAFAYIFATTDIERLLATAASAEWGRFWFAAFGLYLMLFVVDAYGVYWVYRRHHVPGIRFADVLPARGTSYLLGILNYAAGSAAMAFYFKRKFGVGVIEGGASLLLLMLVDLGIVISAVIIGGAMLPPEWAQWAVVIRFVGAAFALGVVAHIVFWRARWSWGPLEAIRNHPSFRGFRDATVVDYLTLIVVRAPVTIMYVLLHVATLSAFHISIPWARMLVYVPIQMFIAVVPISPSGLGTINVVQRYLYTPYAFDADGVQLLGADAMAHIDAYALALSLAFNVPRVILGLLSLRAAQRALADASPRR